MDNISLLIEPNAIYVSRAEWMASPVIPHNNISFGKQYRPARLVIIQHSGTTACHSLDKCSAAMRKEQILKIGIGQNTP